MEKPSGFVARRGSAKLFGMTQSEADHSVFNHYSAVGCIYLIVYVGDSHFQFTRIQRYKLFT